MEHAKHAGRPHDAQVIEARARRLMKDATDATAEAMRAAQETGELQHLYGQSLDLSDTSPEWFANKLLKREGVAPPTIERAKDIDKAQREAEALLQRLQRRRDWLCTPEAACTAADARAFNRLRLQVLDGYREALVALNKAIRDFNLTAPLPLHRYGIIVDREIERAAREIPPLPEPAQPARTDQPARPRCRFWHKLWPRTARD